MEYFIMALFFIVLFGAVLAVTGFWIWMLVDCLSNETNKGERVKWALIIVFTHFVGAIIYYFVRRRPRTITSSQMGSMSQS